jgi:hypothetical protein
MIAAGLDEVPCNLARRGPLDAAAAIGEDRGG